MRPVIAYLTAIALFLWISLICCINFLGNKNNQPIIKPSQIIAEEKKIEKISLEYKDLALIKMLEKQGNYYWQQGDFGKAKSFFNKEILLLNSAKLSSSTQLINTARFFIDANDPKQANALLLKAIEIATKQSEKTELSQAHNLLALVHYINAKTANDNGRVKTEYKQAKENFEIALSYAKAANKKELAENIENNLTVMERELKAEVKS
jgi:tetratricopeptide (TPR) repeat protein